MDRGRHHVSPSLSAMRTVMVMRIRGIGAEDPVAYLRVGKAKCRRETMLLGQEIG